MNSPQSEPSLGEILVVDDSVPSLRVLVNLLAELGYQVRSARDGETALMIAAADAPDLILLDVMMPGLNGFEVCRQLKERPETKEVPVIFVSGMDEVVDKVRGFEAGGVDYITKPYKVEEVQVRVKTHLMLYQLRKELGQRNQELQQEIKGREKVQEALKQRQCELRRRVEELSAVSRIAQIVATTADITDALTAVAEQITRVFSARLTLITVPDDKYRELKILTGFEQTSGAIAIENPNLPLLEMPISRGVLASGETKIINDILSLSLVDPVRAFGTPYDLCSNMAIPLKVRGTVIGILNLGLDDPEREFSREEITLAETISSDIAGAIENARLAEKARVAAIDAERQRLARELHDSVTQSLYSLTLLSSGWRSMAEQGTLEDAADSFRRLGDLGQQALKEMRLLIHQLRPPVLDELGMVQALQQRLDIVELRASVESRLLIAGDVENLPDEWEEQLFHIAQEALNNSLRHAFASEVIVRIKIDDEAMALSVEDDGAGFDSDTVTYGLGLVNMRERAESIGADLVILSEPGIGTTVKASLPLPQI